MEQLSFGDLNFVGNSVTASKKEDIFGCCSHFRDCSDAKECLKPEKIDYENCAYKKNLESGKIFYGKNANGFDINIYNQFVEKYDSLDDLTRQELNGIIVLFVQNRTSFMYYSSKAVNTLLELGFIAGYISKGTVIARCEYNFLSKFLSAETKQELTNKARKRENNPKARMKKHDVIDWIMNHDIQDFDNYVSRFIIISVPPDIQKYIFELYYEFIMGDNIQYKLILPEEKEPFAKNNSDT